MLVERRKCDITWVGITTRAEEVAAAPSGLKEMQDCHPAVVYQPKKSLSGAFLFCVA